MKKKKNNNQCFLFSVRKLQSDAVWQCITDCSPPGQIKRVGFLEVKVTDSKLGRILRPKHNQNFVKRKQFHALASELRAMPHTRVTKPDLVRVNFSKGSMVMETRSKHV